MKHLLFIVSTFIVLHSSFSFAAIPAALTPQTGQTTCYDAVGAAINCSGTGQDGEIQSGITWPIPRFVDNGDQTLTDELTGLIWSKNANPAAATKTWQEALDYIKALNSSSYLGYNDWRLPNINELKSLVNQGQSPSNWLNTQGFYSVQANYYWSGSTTNFHTSGAWYVSMGTGRMDYNGKASIDYVWPVRSGQSGLFGSLALSKTGQTTCYDAAGATINCGGTGQDGELQAGTAWPTTRFSVNNDQTVTDGVTGLVWSKNANPAAARKTWQGALDYIKTLNSISYLGYNDWRLPNINELASLTRIGNSDSANWLATQGFSTIQTNGYWSGSNVASGSSYAWGVTVNTGYMYFDVKSAYYYVWPVRSVQVLVFDYLTISATPRLGTAPIGTPIPSRQITIDNLGTSSQSVGSIAVNGTNASEFSITNGGSNQCGTITPTVAADASCTLMLGFSPANSGAKNASLDVTVNGITNSIPLSATTISTVYGVVTDQSTALPVSGATVTLNTAAITTTDTEGSYSFGDLPTATYGISIAKTGYQTISKSGLATTTTASVKADITFPIVGTLNITTTSLPWASSNVYYSNRVMVAGGTAPYTFSKPTGTLPAGLSLDTATGIISGTPTVSGIYIFAIGVTDNALGYVEKEFTIELILPLQISTASLPAGQQGTLYNSSIIGIGGKAAYSVTIIEGTLPNEITLATTGTLSGNPREAGTFNIKVKLTDSTGVTTDKTFTLTLTTADALTLNTTTLTEGYFGTSYSTTLSASGGVSARTFSVTGTLPTGLSLNSATGKISGTPSVAGLTNLTFTVTDYSYPTAQTVSGVIPLRIWSILNGACGTSNGGTFSVIPSAELCNNGTAGTITGTGPWNWKCTGSTGGTTANCSANVSYIVTPTATPNYTTTPATPQTVTNNTTTTFTVTPATGYGVVVSGCSGSFSGTTYTTGAITAGCTVSVTAVVRDANSGGTAQPPTITDALKVLSAVVGITPLTAAEQIRYDVAPLGSIGTPLGNGAIDDADVILILRRSIGIGGW